MAEISDEVLQALCDTLKSLKRQVDIVMRERVLYRKGATALTSLAKVAAEPGRIVGNASQPIMSAVDYYALSNERRPLRPIKHDDRYLPAGPPGRPAVHGLRG